MLVIALRLAIQARRRSINIEKNTGNWSIAMPGDAAGIAEVEAALDEFHQSHVNPSPIRLR